MVLQLTNVTKRYKDFTAVDHLNFSIDKGEIFGLIGQNGAGKTTTKALDLVVAIGLKLKQCL